MKVLKTLPTLNYSCSVGNFLAPSSTGTNRPTEDALLLLFLFWVFQRCFFK